jgi:ABC-type glycerol-3-phosphate transport system substrate-binding protein
MQPLKLIVLALLGLPAAALLTFGPRGDEALPQDDDVVVVEYWEKWTGNEERQMRQIVDAFNAGVGRERKIFVRYLSTSAINQKTLVATAAGTPPDIAGLWDSNIVPYAAQDALEPLEEMARAKGITRDTYKASYWNACNYDGHLYALVSTPGIVALLYNRLAFEAAGAELRAAGLDPHRAPATLAELDAYADVLTKRDPSGRVTRAGYFPMEPNWYVPYIWMWFGGEIWDSRTEKFNLTDPKVVAAFDWIASYTRKLGKGAATEFRGGLGNFDSPQNAFLVDYVVMEQQGPWMANYIDNLRPDLQRLRWPREVEMTKPIAERRQNYSWAVAPFPSTSPARQGVTYATFDALVIPRGAKHKTEAFEFIAYVNRQDVMEKLCTLHCKNSPLARVSESFLAQHPNPYIEVFEDLAKSPNARGVPQVPILQEVFDELTAVGQAMALDKIDAAIALRQSQTRLQASYDRYAEIQRARRASASASGTR